MRREKDEQTCLFNIGTDRRGHRVSLPLPDCERGIAYPAFAKMARPLSDERSICPQYNHFSSISISMVQ